MLERMCLAMSLAACVACSPIGSASEEPTSAIEAVQSTRAPVDPAFHARVKRQIESVVGRAYAEHDWDALLSVEVSWNGVHVWGPGTGEATGDVPDHGRAMGAVPDGLAADGSAMSWSSVASSGDPLPLDAWLGVPCAQSQGGALWAQRGIFSALDVFNTAWSDALAIVARFGPRLRGAWLVGHSAGALPVLLAGLIGGAHRVDIYGVPSAVGYLDGDDGIAHFHTDPLDPAGAMGWIASDGKATINLGSALVVAIQAGGLGHHDYSTWPAPTP